MARPWKSNEIMNTQYTSKKVRTPKKKKCILWMKIFYVYMLEQVIDMRPMYKGPDYIR